MKSRNASTLIITQADRDTFKDTADEVIRIPAVESSFAPLVSVVPAQLFSYYCAILRGNDPDKPRNLAKSVTVE